MPDNNDRELLEGAFEYLLSLRSAWDWKATEPRERIQKEWQGLNETIKKVEQRLKAKGGS